MVRVTSEVSGTRGIELQEAAETARTRLAPAQASGGRAGRVAVFAALGGLLFGLDIGYISGVEEMASFADDINGGRMLTDATQGFITGAFSIGAIATSCPPVGAAIVDRLGRKMAIVAGALLFCAGALLQALASGLVQMDVGRALAGASIGVLSTNVPVYQSEVAEPRLRGACVALYQLAITVGITAAFWLNWALSSLKGGWRLSIFAQLLPGLLLAAGMLAMPRSPRWLLSQGRLRPARRAPFCTPATRPCSSSTAPRRHGATATAPCPVGARFQPPQAVAAGVGRRGQSTFLIAQVASRRRARRWRGCAAARRRTVARSRPSWRRRSPRRSTRQRRQRRCANQTWLLTCCVLASCYLRYLHLLSACLRAHVLACLRAHSLLAH